MAENNQILRTTLDDVERLNQLVIGSSVRNLRVLKGQVERRIIIFERRLVELYNNEALVKARIYNNADSITIANNYAAGLKTQVNPVQSFQDERIVPDPHRSYAYNKFNILSLQPGLKALDSELNRINGEIQHLQRLLDDYNKIKSDIDNKLTEAEEKEKTNLFDKTFGRVLPPTQADLEKDKIARARIANILLLQRIAVMYRDYTIDPDTQKAKYPDESKLPHDLQILRQIFWSHGQSEGIVYNVSQLLPWEVPIRNVLNFDNPGDAQNIETLNSIVDAERTTGRNTKIDIQINRFVKDVLSTANDPLISQGIERKDEVPLALENSVREQTKSYPAAAMRLGDFYIGSFELPSFTESLRKRWKKKNEKLYTGLPTCPNVNKSELATVTNTKEEALQIRNLVNRTAGEDKYKKALENAQTFINKQVEDLIGDIPSDAPDWVTIYARQYGTASRGLMRYEGAQTAVTRTQKSERNDAIEGAKNLKPTDSEKLDEYVYESITGYTIKYQNDSTEFISINEIEDIENQSVDSRGPIISREPVGFWIAYILWFIE